MTTVQTFLANGFETASTSSIGPTDTTFPAATAGSASAPGWLVIEPDDVNQREYFKYTSKDSNNFFVGTTDNRYGSGSAASSGLTHPSGSIIRCAPLQQHHEELWSRINEITHDEDHAARHSQGADDSLSAYYVPKSGGSFTGQVQVTANGIAVTGNSTFANNVTVTGAVSVGATLGVTGNTTLGGTLGVTGNVTGSGNIGGATISSAGLATLNSATITTTLSVGGVTTLNGNLIQSGTTTTLTASDEVTINGNNEVTINSASGDVNINAGSGDRVNIPKLWRNYGLFYRSSNFSVAADTETNIPLTTVHGTSTIGSLSSGRIVINEDGLYIILAVVWFEIAGGGDYRRAYLYLDTGDSDTRLDLASNQPFPTIAVDLHLYSLYPLGAGHEIRIAGRSNGAAVPVVGGGYTESNTRVAIIKVGEIE